MKKLFIVLFSLLAISSLLAAGSMASLQAFNNSSNTGEKSMVRAKTDWQPRVLTRNGDREVLLTQEYDGPDVTGWSAGFSDLAAGTNGRICYDNFTDVSGSIESISFYGFCLYFNGTGWEDGTEDPMTVQIKFYAEAADGSVGTMVAEYEMDLSRQNTGELYNTTIPLYLYEATFATPVDLPRGWISIQGVGTATEDAILAWMSSQTGQDGTSLNFDGTSWGTDAYDRSLTFNGTAYDANTLSGNVTLNGGTGNVEEVVVKLYNNGNYWGMANPTTAGVYAFSIPAGTYDLEASLHGYTASSYTDVVVTLPFSAQDITLDAITAVSVSGHVEGSDNVGTGLAGATVSLTGYEDYEVTTDANGDFTITDVYTEETYAIEISRDNYTSYTADVPVATTDVNLGTITLTEQTNPPVNVTATANNEDTEVTVAWSYPAAQGDEWVENFDASTDLPAGWLAIDNDGDGHNWYGLEVTFPIGAHSGTNVATSRSWHQDDGTLNPDNYLITPETAIGGNTYLNFWAAGLEAAYAVEPFLVKVSTSGTNPADFTDTIADITTDSTWVQHNISLAAYAGQDIYIAFEHTQTLDNNFLGIDDISITNGPIANDREVLSYNVYRFLESDADNEDNWTLVAENVTDTTCVDDGYATLQPGIYQWGVKAKYTGDIMSDAGLSNTIERNMYATVTVNVTLDSGDSPEGAVVTLTETEGDRTYSSTAPASGEVIIADVFKSFYLVTVTLPMYENGMLNNQPIFGDTETLNVTLEEMRLAPVAAECTDAGLFTWEDPLTFGDDVLADFNNQAFPAGWLNLDVDGDTYTWAIAEITAGSDYCAMSESWNSTAGALTPNNYLIIPNIAIGVNYTLTFDAGGTSANYPDEVFYVKVSTSGNAATDFTTDLLGPITTVYGLTPYSVDLGDYVGQEISLAFVHTGCNDVWALALDNVVVGNTVTREISFAEDFNNVSNNVVRNTQKAKIGNFTKSGDRHFVNYKVYLDGSYVGETDSLFYQFSNLEDNTQHTAGVTAVYSSGEESAMSTADFTANGVTNDNNAVPAFETALGSNYPNPFNPVTYINYSVKEDGPVSIEIYNLKGQKVKTLVNEANHKAGKEFQTIWNGTNNASKSVSSGVYFYRMKTGRYTSTKKMILMK